MPFTESIVEDAALAWLGELRFGVLHRPDIAPGELAAERARKSPYPARMTAYIRTHHEVPELIPQRQIPISEDPSTLPSPGAFDKGTDPNSIHDSSGDKSHRSIGGEVGVSHSRSRPLLAGSCQ